MNNLKKFASIMLAMIMVLAMSIPAFAEGESTGTITINGKDDFPITENTTLKAYKILDV